MDKRGKRMRIKHEKESEKIRREQEKREEGRTRVSGVN